MRLGCTALITSALTARTRHCPCCQTAAGPGYSIQTIVIEWRCVPKRVLRAKAQRHQGAKGGRWGHGKLQVASPAHDKRRAVCAQQPGCLAGQSNLANLTTSLTNLATLKGPLLANLVYGEEISNITSIRTTCWRQLLSFQLL